MYLKVKDLPASVVAALASVNYGAADIEVEITREAVLSGVGSDGRRAFVIAVKLATGERDGRFGSWGGANMFNPGNAVDNDRRPYVLPAGVIVVRGSTGYPRTYARLVASPETMAKALPAAGRAEATREERDALYCFKSIKGGVYRRDELRRRKVTSATIETLIERGWLKRNSAGATSITTEGKNALGTAVFEWEGGE